MKKIELTQELIKELLKNSRQSDRELGKKLGVSQPTISRARIRLEQGIGGLEKIIKGYTIIPNLAPLGLEIVAVTLARSSPSTEALQNSRVLFASEGEGLGRTFLVISVHNNYADFHTLAGSFGVDAESFLISTRSNKVIKHLSLSFLG